MEILIRLAIKIIMFLKEKYVLNYDDNIKYRLLVVNSVNLIYY
jgi:hypothetical protein